MNAPAHNAAPNPYAMVLQRRIDQNASRCANLVETLQRDVPVDSIVRAAAIKFFPIARTVDGAQNPVLEASFDEDEHPVSDYALQQIAEKAGVPFAYLKEITRSNDSWKVELGCRILNEHFARIPGRVLTRTVAGRIRGVLSDRYRRIDSRPLVEELARACEAFGARPLDGIVTETRCALKVILPKIHEIAPGEFVCIGVEWSNSDFGNGTNSIRAFVLRPACLNGAVAENLLKQVHLGGRLSEDIEMSARTHRLDTAASVSALKDVVAGALAPAGVDRILARLRETNQQSYTSRQLASVVAAQPKATQKAISDAFTSEDVINLPPGNTAWRASNAISWIAKNTQDEEVRLDLERLAGSVISTTRETK